MALLAYNKTTSPLVLAAGSPAMTLPAAAALGSRGPAVNVTAELNGLSGANYTALQVQVAAGSVEYEWSGLPEYSVGTLVVGSAQGELTELGLNFWADPSVGNDAYSGLDASQPKQTFEAILNALPSVYRGALRINLNKDATTSAQNTAKKVYTLSNQALQVLFPIAQGKNAETPYIFGGYTNELGDLTATAGSVSSLTTNQNLTLDAYAGAVLKIVSGTGAGQERIIRGVTAGPNSVISVEIDYTVAPDATSVYRIGYPNVEIRFSQKLQFIAPSQCLFIKGVKFKHMGATGQDFLVGSILGQGTGGTLACTGCEFDMNNSGVKGFISVRSLSPFNIDGSADYWVGPNNPFDGEGANLGNYFHDGNLIRLNVSGQMSGGGNLIKNFTNVRIQSGSKFSVFGGTIDNAPMQIQGDSFGNVAGISTSVRARIRNITGTAVNMTANARGSGNSNVAFTNVEFSNITGDLMAVNENSRISLGNISVAGTNTGVGLKVLTGSKVRVSSTTLLSGNGGAIQIDSNPVMTLAQALAAPFSGTLYSNSVQPYVITDPGDGYAISVASDGVCNLTSGVADGYRTMAAPSYVGQTISLCFDVDGGGDAYVTIATGINAAANTSIQFTAAGQSLVLRGMQVGGAKKWRVVSNDGAILS